LGSGGLCSKAEEKKMKRNNIRTGVIIICLLGITACLLLLIPQVRQTIIEMTEQFLMRRELKDHAKWHKILFRISINGTIFLGLFLFCFLFKHIINKIQKAVCKYLTYMIKKIQNSVYKIYMIKKVISYILKSYKYMNNEIQKVICKDIVISILCMFGLYTFAIIGIIRADFLFVDDLGRAIYGYREWGISFSRHISDFLAVFIHADTRITDISPLPQIIAALFIAIASVLLVYIISDGKVTKTACFLSLPIGLSPYFLACISYKFDSPYMALSVLASVVPFLFIRNYVVFLVTSMISLLIMCMTYQASSGIYIIIVIMLCFKAWNNKEKTVREIIRFAVISASSYCASMIFFRLFLMNSFDNYVSPNIYPIHRLFSGIVNNFISYMRLVNADFSFIWKFLLLILCLTFIITSVLLTKRNRIAVLIVSLTAVAAMCLMSFGVYLALAKSLFIPRAMYGFGVFIACVAVYLSNIPKKIVLLPAVSLCWCFFVFSFTYGNALSEHKRYNNFRTEILLHDLSMLFPDKTEERLLIKLKNYEGFAPSIQGMSIRNPIIRRLVPVNLGAASYWSSIFLTRYYNFNLQQDESIEEDGLNELLDSYYHTIKSDGRKVLVILKLRSFSTNDKGLYIW
jgi:hypothetical protein